MTHTKGPWELKTLPCYDLFSGHQNFNYQIVTDDLPIALLGKEAKAHGEQIIHEHNSHAALVEALEAIVERFEVVNKWANDIYWAGYNEQPDELVDNNFDILNAKKALAQSRGELTP